TLTPSCCRSTVAWLTNVARMRPAPTSRGGGGPGGWSRKGGHFAGCRVRRNFSRLPNPPARAEAPGRKNLRPSKWSLMGYNSRNVSCPREVYCLLRGGFRRARALDAGASSRLRRRAGPPIAPASHFDGPLGPERPDEAVFPRQ